jgi:pheromone shutdown protein TraB
VRPAGPGGSLHRRGPSHSLSRGGPPRRPGCRAFTKLSETSTHLKEADREIYLVGTSHISSASAREVADLIRQVKPDYVAVELCEQRYQRVKELPPDADQQHSFAESVQAVLSAVGQHGPLAGVFAALNEAMRNTGLMPGVDFKSAIDAAEQVGAKVRGAPFCVR